jgi:hypothetical protein
VRLSWETETARSWSSRVVELAKQAERFLEPLQRRSEVAEP